MPPVGAALPEGVPCGADGVAAARSSIGTLYSCRIAVISLLRRSITESSRALSSLSRCRTAIAMLKANGIPETGSESGSATIVSATGARLTQYPARGPHTMATSIESFATARMMSSGWSALGSGFKKLPNPTRPTMPREHERDLVLESLFLFVGKRQVERVGADPELLVGVRRARHETDGCRTEQAGSREFGPSENHRSPCWSDGWSNTRCRSAFAPAPGVVLRHHCPATRARTPSACRRRSTCWCSR